MNPTIEDLCLSAWETGQTLDLEHCHYGQVDGRDIFVVEPNDYYYFLAGLTRTQAVSRVLKIGTHMGGSILAIHEGIPEALRTDARILTVDVTDLSAMALKPYPAIHKLIGDGLGAAINKAILEFFDHAPIDLLFIDADHDYSHTMLMYGFYATMLRPRFTVFDDIHLNLSMRSFWHDIRRTHPGHSVAVQRIVPEVRAAHVGLGLVAAEHAARPASEPSGIASGIEQAEQLFAAGQIQAALEQFRTLSAIDPCDPLILNDIAICLWKLDDLKGALEHLNQAVEIAPGRDDHAINLLKVLVQAGHAAQASAIGKRYLELYPQTGKMHALLDELNRGPERE